MLQVLGLHFDRLGLIVHYDDLEDLVIPESLFINRRINKAVYK